MNAWHKQDFCSILVKGGMLPEGTRFLTLLAMCAVITGFQPGQAQSYPTKFVRIIVGSGAGGGVDVTARMIAKGLAESMGQAFVVENRTGAGSTIGTEYVAKSPPDGYTLLVGSAATLCIAPAMYANLRYDSTRDFSPISTLVDSFAVLVVHPSLPANSPKEVIALAKSRPTPLTYGSAGVGTHTHLAMELFRSMADFQATHVPYKGGGPALAGLVTGDTNMMMVPVAALGSFAQQGKIKVLGFTSGRRAASMPDLPTIAESGLPGFESSSWYGILAPARTPRDIVMKLNGAVVKHLNSPEMTSLLRKQGLFPVGDTPEEFAQLIKSELPKWARVVAAAGIKKQ